MGLRRASYSLKVRAVCWIPARAGSEEEARVAAFARSGRIICSFSAVARSSACWSAVVRACFTPSSTSWRETNIIWAWISGARLSQTEARYRRWGTGPRVPTSKALGGRGELGRNPGVRPVHEPGMSRKAVDATGEVLSGGCVAKGDGGAAMVLSADVEAVLLVVLAAEVVREDMLREARKGARGEKPRGGHMEPTVKGGCSAMSVLVTRGIVAATL